jgi:DNA-binding MarR family transcriptional regulator
MSAARFLVALSQIKPSKLTLRACAVLMILAEEAEPVKFGELATLAEIPKAALVHIVDRLEAAGLAQRVKGPKWRERVLVQIAPKGVELAQAINRKYAVGVSGRERNTARADVAVKA